MDKIFSYKGGKKLFYSVSGDGEAIILLHGWGQSHKMWGTLIDDLIKRYKVYVLDLPGFGSSDTPDRSFEIPDYVQVLKEFVDSLDLKNISIIAHSFSGRIALMYAMKNPVKILLLTGTNPFKASLFKRLLFRFCFTLFPQLFYWVSCNLLRPRTYTNSTSYNLKRSQIMFKTYMNILNTDVSDSIKKLPMETFLIHGKNDFITNVKVSQRLKEGYPDQIRLKMISGGHFPHIQNREEFMDALVDFGILKRGNL